MFRGRYLPINLNIETRMYTSDCNPHPELFPCRIITDTNDKRDTEKNIKRNPIDNISKSQSIFCPTVCF